MGDGWAPCSPRPRLSSLPSVFRVGDAQCSFLGAAAPFLLLPHGVIWGFIFFEVFLAQITAHFPHRWVSRTKHAGSMRCHHAELALSCSGWVPWGGGTGEGHVHTQPCHGAPHGIAGGAPAWPRGCGGVILGAEEQAGDALAEPTTPSHAGRAGPGSLPFPSHTEPHACGSPAPE